MEMIVLILTAIPISGKRKAHLLIISQIISIINNKISVIGSKLFVREINLKW